MAKNNYLKIHLLYWKYYDGSDCGYIRAYHDKIRAEEDYELVKGSTEKRYYLVEVDVVGSEN